MPQLKPVRGVAFQLEKVPWAVNVFVLRICADGRVVACTSTHDEVLRSLISRAVGI